MPKGKYKAGKYYECERCGNVIKLVTEGGGNIICCVKALGDTSPPPGELAASAASPARPAASPAPAVMDAVPVPDDEPEPPKAAAKRGPRGAATASDPVDIFGVRDERDEDDAVASVFRKKLFEVYSTEVELLRLLYGQEEMKADPDRECTLTLLEGRGIFVVGTKSCEVTTGATVLVPRGVTGGIKNTMPDAMVVLRVVSGD